MLTTLRKAYKGGWRSGMAGASWRHNPHRNIILRVIWDNGWHRGMTRQLNFWLKGRCT